MRTTDLRRRPGVGRGVERLLAAVRRRGTSDAAPDGARAVTPVRSRRPSLKVLARAGAAAALVAGALVGASATAGTAQAATSGPCDIYASGGTPCVAAHSTTRALYAAYNGPLYQVRRSSDNTT
uniref:arabinofuranosidase catalytic domain-containing protein n=1 Tax=Streptomyces sp. HPF1205 TaxID=2873262 RepID=UPI0027E16FF2